MYLIVQQLGADSQNVGFLKAFIALMTYGLTLYGTDLCCQFAVIRKLKLLHELLHRKQYDFHIRSLYQNTAMERI